MKHEMKDRLHQQQLLLVLIQTTLTATLTDSPLTDKDMSLQIPKLPWPSKISLLLLSLTTDS